MYPWMKYDRIKEIAENPEYYTEYDRKCAIYHLNKHIESVKIVIKQYKHLIEMIEKGGEKKC